MTKKQKMLGVFAAVAMGVGGTANAAGSAIAEADLGALNINSFASLAGNVTEPAHYPSVEAKNVTSPTALHPQRNRKPCFADMVVAKCAR